MDVADALVALGGAFLAAGLLARIGRRIELPTIPLFMLAGIIFGPETWGIVLFDNPDDLKVLAALGLVLLLFYIGLEFSIDDITSGGRSLLLAGGAYLLFNVGGGLLFGLALGWGTSEALVLAGILGISSSAIVSKLLVELGRLKNHETPLVLGIIVIEDVFLALYLALLAPVLGGAQGAGEVVVDIALAFGLLLALAAVARWGAHAVAKLIDAEDDELFVVCFIGLVLLVSGLSEELGVKYAIGALMVGIILGGSALRERLTHFVHPLRDAFGALFFFAFGLTIDPGDVVSVLGPVAIAVVVTFVLNMAAGVVAARVRGLDREAATNIGLTLVSRGEFALVLGTLAAAAGLDRRIAPFVAGYVLFLAILGPLAATHSAKLARLVPEGLVGSPRPSTAQ
jgi:CPA2 family monovalent cation:H+ antiporter-2